MEVNMAEMYVGEDVHEAARRAIDSKRWINGPEAKGLEAEFAEFCGAKQGVSCSSGTTALMLAMDALGIGKGDEIICPSHTFIATATPAVHRGARPVFADVDPVTYTIDPEHVGKLITDKTKAIIAVHLYGQPADMDPLREVADERGIPIVEDSCQAHEAEYKGKRTGTLGKLACFSFFPSKNMTVAGDGGIVVTDDEELAERMVMLRNQGRRKGKKYTHDAIGYNFRLSEILAAIGRVQLKHLPEWTARRREVAVRYNELLDGVVETPKEAEGRKHVYYVYTVQTDRRDELKERLKQRGVNTNIYYPVPVHQQPAITELFGTVSLPVTEKICPRIISLPMFPKITEEQIQYVAAQVKDFVEGQ